MKLTGGRGGSLRQAKAIPAGFFKARPFLPLSFGAHFLRSLIFDQNVFCVVTFGLLEVQTKEGFTATHSASPSYCAFCYSVLCLIFAKEPSLNISICCCLQKLGISKPNNSWVCLFESSLVYFSSLAFYCKHKKPGGSFNMTNGLLYPSGCIGPPYSAWGCCTKLQMIGDGNWWGPCRGWLHV